MTRNLPAGAHKEPACGRRLVKKEGGPAGRRPLYSLGPAGRRPHLASAHQAATRYTGGSDGTLHLTAARILL